LGPQHTTASIHDSNAAADLLERLRDRFKKITLVWADGGHVGRLVTWAKEKLQLTVQIVKRSDDVSGFVVLPRLLWNLNCQLQGSVPLSVDVAKTPVHLNSGLTSRWGTPTSD
jgi:hypothetical protein